MPRKIRLAMLRVDGHLYHFAPVIAELDMLPLRDLAPEVHYWFHDCYRPTQVNQKVAKGFEVTRLWDYDPEKARTAATVFTKTPLVVEDVNDLLSDVDAAFIANCGGDGSDHLRLATPFIKRGIATFIDKPFALDTKDAVTMVKLARQHGTPIYSSSLLSVAQEVQAVRSQLRHIGKVTLGIVTGCWGWATASGQEGVIHGVSLAQAIFGAGVKTVEAFGEYPAKHISLSYPSGLEVLINLYKSGLDTYTAQIHGSNRDPIKRTLDTGPIGNTSFAPGASTIAHRFRRMVTTGKPPRDYDDIIENIAVCQAARKSWKLGRKVKITDIWKR